MTAADTIKDIHVEVKRCPDCGARFGVEAAFCPFDGIPLSTSTWDKADDPRAHIRVDDRYEVLEPLGEGGMGTVYKVRHVTLDRHFAMKVLRRDLASDADLAARFLQEARATAVIKHPSVVAITDFGDMEDGVPYFVMELLEGETLATRIRARGPVPPGLAIGIAKQIADALAASHAANVIHRDLKPDNVFLVGKTAGRAAEDEIRLVDFGAAKIIGGSKLTRPGIVFGTPYYMSPEQASGQPIDARADVYSLGVLIYEMITGRVPFEADTYMGVLTKHIFEAPPRPMPPPGIQLGELESVVMRALQKDPEARYASMSVFASALEQAGTGRRSAAPQGLEHVPPRTMKMGSMTTADRIERSVSLSLASDARRQRWRLIVIGSIAACATVAVGGVILSTLAPPQTSTMTPAGTTARPKPVVVGASASTGAVDKTTEPALAEPTAATAPVVPSTAVLSAPAPLVVKRAPAPPPAAALSSKPPAPSPPSPSPAGGGGGTEDFKDPWKH